MTVHKNINNLKGQQKTGQRTNIGKSASLLQALYISIIIYLVFIQIENHLSIFNNIHKIILYASIIKRTIAFKHMFNSTIFWKQYIKSSDYDLFEKWTIEPIQKKTDGCQST